MSDATQLVIKRIGTYDLTGSRLGKGNFATVELAINRVTKSKVAIKIIDTRKIKDDYVKRNILREALILKKIHHPNVVKLYETLKQRGIYCLVTEFIAGGELLSLIRSQHESKLTEAQARPIVRQTASALHHLHERGIVHRDLKMENILLDESKKNIKLVDFGLSNVITNGQLLKTQCGSPEYAAPELFKKDCRYGPEVDLWSLGVVTFGMLVGKLPFRTFHSGIRGRNDLVDQMSNGLSVAHSKFMNSLSSECRDLLRKLLEPNPLIRLPLKELMIHPWITKAGEWLLHPYSPPELDHELVDKVLTRVASLIKMPRSKLEVHISRNRYDTISGIYHLTLDEYVERDHKSITALSKDWKDRNIVGKQAGEKKNTNKASKTANKEKDIIKVCIKKGTSDQENPDSHNEEKVRKEQKCDKTEEIIESNKTTNLPGDQGLQVRGMRLYSPKSRDIRTCRPHTTESKLEYRHVHSRARPCSMYVNNNKRQVITATNREFSDNHSKCEKSTPSDDPNDKPKQRVEQEVTHTQTHRPQNQTQKRLYSGVTAVTIKTTELQRRTSKPPRHIRQAVLRKPTLNKNGYMLSSPEHSVTQRGAPTKAGNDNQTAKTLVTQSAQANTERVLTNAVKRMGLSEKKLAPSEDNKAKISESMLNIYQRYLANCTPHHKRLSIMQAHDIIQREHTFQSKYGKKINTENADVNERPNADVTPGKSSHVAQMPQHCIKNVAFPAKTPQQDKKDLLVQAAQCSWFKNDVQDSGVLNNKNFKEVNSNDKPPDKITQEKNQQMDEKQRRAAQEINLRLQKQKELFKEVEMEHSRIERDLHDTERVKLIEQYLDDVYSRYNSSNKAVQLESTARLSSGNKFTPKRKGNIFSWLPKKHQHGTFGPGTVNMPASILNQSKDSPAQNGSSGGNDKKIEFKENSVGAQSTRNESLAKFRFFNEWSKTSFNNYVNSDGQFLICEADQDFSNQFSDPSYWLKNQINSAGHF